MPVFFRLLYCCGLRVSEVCNLKIKDVDLSEGVLKIYNSKFKNNRIVPMTTEVTQHCSNYLKKVQKIENSEISRSFTTSNNSNSSSYYTKDKIGIDI